MILLSESPLTFDATAHQYFLNGVLLPSVTRVLEAAGRLLNYAFLGERELYLERGRLVHLVTQQDDEGCLAAETVDEEISGYIEAWRRFKRDYSFTPHSIERKVFHPQLKFAGTLDRTGSVRDGTEVIIDIKSGMAPDAVAIQLAAYASCLPHPRVWRRRCVELHADRTYRVIPYETRDYLSDFQAFAAALARFKEEQ